MIDLIYLMGGEGKRANLGYPKQYAYIGGKYLFMHGLEIFCKIKDINNIIIPVSNKKEALDKFDIPLFCSDYKVINNIQINSCISMNNKNIIICDNGTSRQGSVKEALKYVNTDFVLIGEAVRPFVTEELIMDVINFDGVAVTPASQFKSTVINKEYGTPIIRDSCGEVQMPQKYRTILLNDAYKKINTLTNLELKDFTDDSHLIASILGQSVKVIDGIESNIKVTTPLDLDIANVIYRKKFGEKNE